MLLFLDSTQSILNFGLSFVGIHKVLRGIRLFDINFKLEILTKFEFWGVSNCQQTVYKITKFHSHFQLKSKR